MMHVDIIVRIFRLLFRTHHYFEYLQEEGGALNNQGTC